MRFLIDAQLPPALARKLVEIGHEAEHVFDRRLNTASDQEIWIAASNLNAVIVTKDEDFSRMRVARDDGPSVIWIRLPNTPRAVLLARVEAVLPDLLDALARGERLVEVI